MDKNRTTKQMHDVNFEAQEIKCAELLIKHFDIEQIANKLRLSESTIHSYISSMQQKTGCNTRIELIEWLFES